MLANPFDGHHVSSADIQSIVSSENNPHTQSLGTSQNQRRSCAVCLSPTAPSLGEQGLGAAPSFLATHAARATTCGVRAMSGTVHILAAGAAVVSCQLVCDESIMMQVLRLHELFHVTGLRVSKRLTGSALDHTMPTTPTLFPSQCKCTLIQLSPRNAFEQMHTNTGHS